MLRASSVVLLCYTIDLSRTGYLEELVPRRVSRKYGQRNEEVNMIHDSAQNDKKHKSLSLFSEPLGNWEHLEKPNTKIITKSCNFSDSGDFLVVNSTVYTKEPSVTQQHQF